MKLALVKTYQGRANSTSSVTYNSGSSGVSVAVQFVLCIVIVQQLVIPLEDESVRYFTEPHQLFGWQYHSLPHKVILE